jgi:hypothetical protein
MAQKRTNLDRYDTDFTIDDITQCQLKMGYAQQATSDLYDAIANNDFEAAKKAISRGADVNASNQPCTMNPDSPLDTAAYWANTYNCSTKMIELLRLHGARHYNLDLVKFLEESNACKLVKKIQKKK